MLPDVFVWCPFLGLKGRETFFPIQILYPISSCDEHPWLFGHDVLGSGGEFEWDRAQLCLACFLYFYKSISIIPRWPNRCHMELAKAQSHDSKKERRPGHGSSQCAAAFVPGLLKDECCCLPGISIQDGEGGSLPLRILFHEGVLSSAKTRADEHLL